jgi:putative ABC transport system substrate-binding protein
MKRRMFLTLLGAATAWPLRAQAQQPDRLRRIGALFPLADSDPEQMARRAGLRQELERLGRSDGRTVHIDYRYAGGQDKFEPLAKEMVGLQPDLIFVQSTGFVAAVARETRTIPIVFANVSDPVGSGFVASLPRPGGNLTGLLLFEGGIAGKWLAMLKEVSPRLKRATLIIDPQTTPFDYFFRPAEAAAPSLAIELGASRVGSPADIERAIEAIALNPDSGLIIAPGSTMLRNRNLVITLAARHRLPAVYPEQVYARDGGLLSYGTADLIEPFRQAATYIDRILRGAKPADLPVQGPTKYATVLNLKTAKALGLTVPSGLLVAADEVIE